MELRLDTDLVVKSVIIRNKEVPKEVSFPVNKSFHLTSSLRSPKLKNLANSQTEVKIETDDSRKYGWRRKEKTEYKLVQPFFRPRRGTCVVFQVGYTPSPKRE